MQVSRAVHINESRKLLWELVTSEPTILQCFTIIESTCLSQGIVCKIDNEPCSPEFHRFVSEHYTPFVRNAIRYMFTYGFIPWYCRKDAKTREMVPDIVPHGTFHWSVDISKPEADTLVHYKIQVTSPIHIKEDEVVLTPYIHPAFDICSNSAMYATVVSPLSHVLVDYKNLRQAQLRRSHADAWNTTARVACTFKPSVRVQEDPSANYMDFADDDAMRIAAAISMPMAPGIAAHNLWSRDTHVQQQFQKSFSAHNPEVYTLPRDHDVQTQPMLTPCEDLSFLLTKFQQDVGAVLGIPFDMIQTHAASRDETVKKTQTSGRLFLAHMHNCCKFINNLLKQVYTAVYHKDNVEFITVPAARLEIQSIQDLKVLHEIGSITPDMSLYLSTILFGEEIATKPMRSAPTMVDDNDIRNIKTMSIQPAKNKPKSK